MTDERKRREGEVLAPALYAPENTTTVGDGVEVTGKPLRGEVKLLSVYTPASWFATCGACPALWGHEDSPDSLDLRRWATGHRCGTDRTAEVMAIIYGVSDARR